MPTTEKPPADDCWADKLEKRQGELERRAEAIRQEAGELRQKLRKGLRGPTKQFKP